jgi:hypothetical protein
LRGSVSKVRVRVRMRVRVRVIVRVRVMVRVRVRERVRARVCYDGEWDCLGGVMVWVRVLLWVFVRVSV